MQQADAPRFNAIMNGLSKLYEREADRALLDAYWAALADWSIEEFQAGAVRLMRTSTFMPRPADFNALRRAALPSKGEAWAKVLQHIKGDYRRQGGLSPEIDAAVRAMGGYGWLAMMATKELTWQERRFCEHYEDVITRGQDAPAPAALPNATVQSMLEGFGK